MKRYLLSIILCLCVSCAWAFSTEFVGAVASGGTVISWTLVDFTTFTEYDDSAGAIGTPTATTLSWSSLRNDTPARCAKAESFTGDFSLRVTLTPTYKNYLAYTIIFGATTQNLDRSALIGSSGDGVYAAYDNDLLHLVVLENGAERRATGLTCVVGTTYYVTIERDDDGGANGTGRYTITSRTGSHGGTVVGTSSIDAAAGQQNDFAWLMAPAAYNSGSSTNRSSSTIANMEVLK